MNLIRSFGFAQDDTLRHFITSIVFLYTTYDETIIDINIPPSKNQGEVPIFLSKNLPKKANITIGTVME